MFLREIRFQNNIWIARARALLKKSATLNFYVKLHIRISKFIIRYNPIEMKFGKILICLLVLSTSALSHPLENKTEANQSKLIDYNEPEKEVSTKSQMEEIELLKTWLNISKTELDLAAKEIKSLENLQDSWTLIALVLVIFSFLILFICLFSHVISQSFFIWKAIAKFLTWFILL